MWDEILWLRQCVTVSQSSCSCILQTRFKMLLAISQMQVRVGMAGRASAFSGAGLPWEQHMDVLRPGKCKAVPVLPASRSATGLGAPALSPLAGRRSWGNGVSDFVAVSCRRAGGCPWVLCWAGWFPAGGGKTLSHVPAA